MSRLDPAKTRDMKAPHRDAKVPISIFQDHARQGPTDQQVLYILGVGIVGIILVNITFVYFAACRTLG
jgi:hypothetical protein